MSAMATESNSSWSVESMCWNGPSAKAPCAGGVLVGLGARSTFCAVLLDTFDSGVGVATWTVARSMLRMLPPETPMGRIVVRLVFAASDDHWQRTVAERSAC